MAGLVALENAFRGRGLTAYGHLARTAISAREHETVELPQELVRPDGSIDVYEDVLEHFRPTYHNNRPSIQCTDWVGYIPLNDAYALDVSPRVPVGNLERLVGMAAGHSQKILRKYARLYGHAEDRPETLFDIWADQLLDSLDRIWENGLQKTYNCVVRVGASPSGRIMPFETAWLTRNPAAPRTRASSQPLSG